MTEDSIEGACYQFLATSYRVLKHCFVVLLSLLSQLWMIWLVIYRATYNITYQLSFRLRSNHATAREPMDDYLPRAAGPDALPTTPLYKYSPLPGPRHIRILQLKQPPVRSLRKVNSIIECDLLPVSLDRPVLINSYRAISYTWDGQSFDRYILCGGEKLAITKNCEDILRHMLKHARLFVWIDAICINQGDNDEKATQIPLMTEIYGRAHLVNVWLGLPSDSTGLVFSYVWLFWCCLCFPKSVRILLERLLYRIIKASDHERHFLDILHRGWWRRVWTIQESALAPEATWHSACPLLVNCGHLEMPLNCLAICLIQYLSLHKIRQRETYVYNGTTWTYLVTCHLNHRTYSCEATPLDLLMFRCRACRVFDPKDRVYGLYGVLEHLGVRLSRVDPAKTKEQVYLDFTREACESTGSLILLNLVANDHDSSPLIQHQQGQRQLQPPSWVPKYDDTFHLGDNWAASKLFAASFSTPHFTFSPCGRVLKTTGILADTIKQRTTTTIWHPPGSSADPLLLHDGDCVNLACGAAQTIRAYREWSSLITDNVDALIAAYGSATGLLDALSSVLMLASPSMFSAAAMSAWLFLLGDGDMSADESLTNHKQRARKRIRSRIISTALKDFRERGSFQKSSHWAWFEIMMARKRRVPHANSNSESTWPVHVTIPGPIQLETGAWCAYPNPERQEAWRTLCALKMWEKTASQTHAVWMHNVGRTLFVTEGIGLLGSASAAVREGDGVFLLSGVDRPMVMRQCYSGEKGKAWRLVGPAYVEGMMRGELWKWEKGVDLEIV